MFIICSDYESKSLQLHNEQLTNQKSDEGNLKIKHSRNKSRKTPYNLHNSPSALNNVQTTPNTDISISPIWQPLSMMKWGHHGTRKSPADNTTHHNPYFPNLPIQTVQEQSPGGSNSSCHGENSTGHQTPHGDSSPITSHTIGPPSCYWRPRNNCLFGAFETAQHTSEELYKVAYGSYYQQLAASAARTYGHMHNPTKLTDLYYNNPYSRFAGSYATHLTGP